VNILKNKNNLIKISDLYLSNKNNKNSEENLKNYKSSNINNKNSNNDNDNKKKEKEKEKEEIENIESAKVLYQRKIDQIRENIEKDKEIISQEIQEKNFTLKNLITSIKENDEILNNIKTQKENSMENLNEITNTNQNFVKKIEEKLETFEQIKKMDNSEIKQNDIEKEIEILEKKFEDMVNNWEEYSLHSNIKIDELKTNLESKKKEYNFKYEKVGLLKKELEEISNKISVKEELGNFLKEEYNKIPVDINRNKFIMKITELTQNINNEKNNIIVYLKDLKVTESQITMVNDNIKKVDNEFEDKLFQDAIKDPVIKEFYALFIKIRDGYNLIQKNIIDMNTAKTKIKEFENKVDDYQMKLKSYDIEQLTEQVDLLKKDNSAKFRK
jgi:hypothetical protein